MATSMNPVEHYHDPSLDVLVTQSDNVRRHHSNRRDGAHAQTAKSPQSNGHEQLLPAPDPPVNPPISYRNVPPNTSGVQRSFSQRAKGRPFADEVFAENNGMASAQPAGQPRQLSGDARDQTRKHKYRSNGPEALQINTGNVHDTQKVRSPVEQTPNVVRDSSTRHRSHRASDSVRQTQEPLSAVSRSSALAPDRSPLQKLEVTLNDISKEEKRARVQEAEMQFAAQRRQDEVHMADPVPEVARRTSSRRTAEQPPQQSHATGRNVNRSVGDRQHSIQQVDPNLVTSRSHSQRHAITQPGYEYIDAEPVRVDATQPAVQRSRSKQAPAVAQLDSSRQPDRVREQPVRTRDVQRSSSTRDPVVQDVVSPIDMPTNPRADSSDRSQPYVSAIDIDTRQTNRVPGYDDLHRNASHKAALQKLTGADPPIVSPTRTNGPRKLQKRVKPTQQTSATAISAEPHAQESPAVRTATKNLDITRPDKSPSIQQQWSGIQRGSSQHSTAPVTTAGLGLDNSNQADDLRSPNGVSGSGSQRQRKSSVSFKEPNDRRPVDEWKSAGIAHLKLGDFALGKSSTADNDQTQDQTWWEQGTSSGSHKSRKSGSRRSTRRETDLPIDDKYAECIPRLFIRCGPLLRYTGMKRMPPAANTDGPGAVFWRGSVLIVTQDSQSTYTKPPVLRLFSRPKKLLPPPPAQVTTEELAPEYVDPIAGLTKMSRTGRALYVRPIDHLEEGKDLSRIENDDGLFEISPSPLDIQGSSQATAASTNKRTADLDGEHVGRFREVYGARLYADPDRDVTFWRFNIEIELGDEQQHIAYRINRGVATGFWVPGRNQSMHVMFHSCNGFSMSVNTNEFNGPDPLWRDVLNTHQTRPFHVMIGGGDQIYNDRVMVETRHFGEWTRLKNPNHKHHALFTNEMKEELETYYLNRYAMWFSQGLFGMANSQIPMINLWDDHDIIDGFGSYPDHFMRAPVFSGVGNIAFKYYMLFQHQSVPSELTAEEPSWLLGKTPGPYINQQSRSVFLSLGRHIAFLGLDCRTERKRDEILSLDTLDMVLERLRKELVEGETKHLLLLLGVPIAYPRLVWLENVLTSRAMDPIKAMGRAGLLKGGFLNKFDGGVELLDDLDDHWTSTNHKSERNDFIKDLQDLAAEKSCRITILSGDVHLGAIGQFYSNPKLKIPKDRDHRYMPNIISSAIVNTPPPDMMADVLNKRNKIHHLDEYTDENMIPIFTHDVDRKKRNNRRLLPRRNWCAIREYYPGSTPPPTPPQSDSGSDIGEDEYPTRPGQPKRRFSLTKEDMNPRNLFRRNKSGNEPPSSYRGQQHNPNQLRSTSYDGSSQGQHFRQGSSDSISQRPSLNSQTSGNRRASSFDYSSTPKRPSMFQRLPTNVSEKAARKGDVPAIDAEGNEIHLNDQINLEGGLDIVLNMEVDKKDPSGITLPYRLLIPALWYDGSSDREKLNGNVKANKRPGFFNRMSLVGRPSHRAQTIQNAQNGQDVGDETESFSGSDVGDEPAPRKKFGFLSKLRGKKDDYDSGSSSDIDQHDNPDQANTSHHAHQQPHNQPQQQNGNSYHDQPSQERRLSIHQQVTAQSPGGGATRTTSRGGDYLYDSSNPPPRKHVPPTQKGHVPQRSITITSQRSAPGGAQSQQSASPQPSTPTRAQGQGSAQQTFSNQQSPLVPQQQIPSKQARVPGIGSTRDSYQEPQQTQLKGNGIIGNKPMTAQRVHSDGDHRQRQQPSQENSDDYSDDYDDEYDEPKRKSFLRFFGAGRKRNSYDDGYDDEPQQRHSQPGSHLQQHLHRQPDQQHQPQQQAQEQRAGQHLQKKRQQQQPAPQQQQQQQQQNSQRGTWYDDQLGQTNTRPDLTKTQSYNSSGGYDGIEAYKAPKPKRGWSLRKAAKEWMDDVRDGGYRYDEESPPSEDQPQPQQQHLQQHQQQQHLQHHQPQQPQHVQPQGRTTGGGVREHY